MQYSVFWILSFILHFLPMLQYVPDLFQSLLSSPECHVHFSIWYRHLRTSPFCRLLLHMYPQYKDWITGMTAQTLVVIQSCFWTFYPLDFSANMTQFSLEESCLAKTIPCPVFLSYGVWTVTLLSRLSHRLSQYPPSPPPCSLFYWIYSQCLEWFSTELEMCLYIFEIPLVLCLTGCDVPQTHTVV